MNGAHFHLVVNHLPIIIPIVALIILAIGFFSKSEAVKRTAFVLFCIGAITSFIAMSSGEEAEEVAEHITGVTKSFIHSHEEAAELFALLSYVLGALSLLSLWASFKQKSFATTTAIATGLFALVSLFFAKNTATTGGEIRHTEIRADYSNSNSSENNNQEE